MTDHVPTYTSLEGRLAADPGLVHNEAGKPYVKVRFTAEPKPEGQGEGRFARDKTVACTLVAYGKAAECLARRFRFGDVVVASGRISEHDPGTFVARRVGHDAARTDYTIARSGQRRQERARRRRRALTTRAAQATGNGTHVIPIDAGPMVPGQASRTACRRSTHERRPEPSGTRGRGHTNDSESLLDAYLAGQFALPVDVAALGEPDAALDEDDLGDFDFPGPWTDPEPPSDGQALGAINLNLLSSAQAAQYWPELDGWVHWLRRDYGLGITIIPPLWHRHAELRWELSALHTAWLAAYDPEAHAGAPITWHRELAEAKHRLHEWVSQSGTSLTEDRPTPVTLWPGEPGFGTEETWKDAGQPTPITDRRADFQAWMAEDVARRRAVEARASADLQAPMLGRHMLHRDAGRAE